MNTSGTSLKMDKGAVSFEQDAEAAIQYAIRDALRDGALKGISDFSQRVLRSNADLDKALDLASKYETILKSLAGSQNEITSAAEAFANDFEGLAKSMRDVGATAGELANVEKYYAEQRAKVLDTILNPLKDYEKSLSGEGSGVRALERFHAAQAEYDKVFDAFKAGNVGQDTFTDAGQELFNLARDIFGTSTSQFQSLRQRLIGDSGTAIGTATDAFNAGAPDKLVIAADTANQIATQQYQQLAVLNQQVANLPADIARYLSEATGRDALRFANGMLMAG